MRKLVRLGKTNPANRDLANSLVSDVRSKNWRGEIAAVFNFVRNEIRYALDTNDIEVLQSPQVTLKLGYGDCDDKCILLATLLECIGHPCIILAMGFDPVETYSHVIVVTSGAGETRPIALDTTEPNPMGWFPPGVTYTMEIGIDTS